MDKVLYFAHSNSFFHCKVTTSTPTLSSPLTYFNRCLYLFTFPHPFSNHYPLPLYHWFSTVYRRDVMHHVRRLSHWFPPSFHRHPPHHVSSSGEVHRCIGVPHLVSSSGEVHRCIGVATSRQLVWRGSPMYRSCPISSARQARHHDVSEAHRG